MSSAVIVTPFGERLCVSMKLRTALPMPARRPLSCVPPEPVGMPLTYDRTCSSVASVHCSTRSSRSPSSFVSVNGASCTGFGAALGDDLLQVVDDAFAVLEDRASPSTPSSSKVTFSPLCR